MTMAYELRELSGSLHKNDRKNTKDHPDYTGSALIGGVEYWLSAWIKDGKKGKWMSLGLKPKDGASKPAAKSSPSPDAYDKRGVSYAEELDDEIPF